MVYTHSFLSLHKKKQKQMEMEKEDELKQLKVRLAASQKKVESLTGKLERSRTKIFKHSITMT